MKTRMYLATAIVLVNGSLAMAQSGAISRIYMVDRDGTNLQLVADENSMTGRNFLGSPATSHDGKWILFDATKNRAFSKTRLVKVCLKGPKKGTVVDLGTGLGGSYSPEDDQIAFFVNNNNPKELPRGAYLMKADGSGRKRLGPGVYPRWSPEGTKLLTANRFFSPRLLHLYEPPATKPTRLLRNEVVLGLPTWSPDGKQFAVTVKDGDHRVLCLFPVGAEDGKRIELWSSLWDDEYEETCPGWSPDGKTILFTFHDADAGQSRIMTVGTTPESAAMEVDLNVGEFAVRDSAWSADGKRIVFAATGQEIYEAADRMFE